MSRKCMFTTKKGRGKTKAGRTRSHSMRQGKRTYKVNLITKKISLGDGLYAKVKISARQYKKYKGLIEWM